jgi:hypothetical protein
MKKKNKFPIISLVAFAMNSSAVTVLLMNVKSRGTFSSSLCIVVNLIFIMMTMDDISAWYRRRGD